jgi:hypothetical protein
MFEVRSSKPVQYTIKEQFNGWSLIEIQHSDLEILDVLINGESIGELVYTGQVYTLKGSQTYGTVLWEPGTWSIWLHENIGVLRARILEEINSPDLSDIDCLKHEYLHTVDRPIHITGYSTSVTGFFANATGPHWFSKADNRNLPYKILDINVDAKALLAECQNFPYQASYTNSWNGRKLLNTRNEAGSECIAADELPETCLELYKQLGWTQSYTFKWLGLEGNSEIRIHRDSGLIGSNPVFSGCNKFYWCINNPPGFMFKMNGVGLLPTHKPLLVNVPRYSHALVNGHEYRHTIESWGD